MVKLKTYSNNLRLIVNEVEYVKSVTMGIMVGAGSSNETAEENGISHFIEHMNFKGTKTRSSFDISDQSECIGAQINAFTSKDSTCFYIKCIDEHADEAFDILSDVFLNPIYPEDELEKERGVILEEINMTEDTPDEICLDAIANAHFGDLGYGATILGPIKNVERFKKQDILSYRKKYYIPSNTVISFAGHITFEQACALVEEKFVSFEGNSSIPVKNVQTDCLCNDKAIDKTIEQAHIALSMPSITYDSPDKTAMICVSSVIGGGMSSRLFQEVREKRGLAYSVYSYISSYIDTGAFYVYAGVNPKNIKSAYDCIIDEITKVEKEGITEKELNRMKEQIKCSTALANESTSSMMMTYGKKLLLSNQIFDINKELEILSKLTLEKVNETAKKYINTQKMATAIVASNPKLLR